MKYDELKEEIKAIADIANAVPDGFKEKCFELLLQHLLTSSGTKNSRDGEYTEATPSSTLKEQGNSQSHAKSSTNNGKIPTPSQMKVFMQKTGITAAELEQIMIYEDDEIHFIHEPTGTKVARGQIEWALLLALKNGVKNNSLAVDPESVRSICQEKGFYDGANFGKNFKAPSNAELFGGPMEKQGEAQKLTPEGLKELATLIKALLPEG